MNTEQVLQERSNNKCELCSSETNLNIYEVPPVDSPNAYTSIYICGTCNEQISDASKMDANHWRCLNDSMWTPVPAIQVVAWRILKSLSDNEAWASDLLDMLYLEEETQQWAESEIAEADDDVKPTRDSNGAILVAGDTITLIKDLVVKGANFTAKRGTTVKNISLTSNPEHIEGRVEGVRVVLLSCFLKKLN